MPLPLPSHFQAALTSERLSAVAGWLLEELHATEDDLSRNTDCGYTRGTTRFGRQKNRVTLEALSGRHDWLSTMNGGNDLVFTIGGVPCRFSNDNAAAPSKDAVLAVNRYQIPFLEFAAADQPGRFCFVIDRGEHESAEARVEFLGFSPSGEVACRWVSSDVRVLEIARPDVPQPVEVAKPVVQPKRREANDGEAVEAGT